MCSNAQLRPTAVLQAQNTDRTSGTWKFLGCQPCPSIPRLAFLAGMRMPDYYCCNNHTGEMKQSDLVTRHWRSISLLFCPPSKLRTQLLLPARGTELSQILLWGLIRCKSRIKPIQSPTKSALTYQHWLNYITIGKKIQIRYLDHQGEETPVTLWRAGWWFRWVSTGGHRGRWLWCHLYVGTLTSDADLWALCSLHKKGLMRRLNPGKSAQRMSLLWALTSMTLCC